jgi:hypothetical protein
VPPWLELSDSLVDGGSSTSASSSSLNSASDRCDVRDAEECLEWSLNSPMAPDAEWWLLDPRELPFEERLPDSRDTGRAGLASGLRTPEHTDPVRLRGVSPSNSDASLSSFSTTALEDLDALDAFDPLEAAETRDDLDVTDTLSATGGGLPGSLSPSVSISCPESDGAGPGRGSVDGGPQEGCPGLRASGRFGGLPNSGSSASRSAASFRFV